MELITKDWKEFRIGDLFRVEQLKRVTNNGGYVLDSDIIEINGVYPYLAAVSVNNGVKGYTNIKPNNEGNCITLSTTADSSNTVFYQPVDFIGRQQMAGIYATEKSKMNSKIAFFIITLLKKQLIAFNYNNKLTFKALKNIKLLLPFKNDEPDWDFMEEFIKGIEEKYIENVDKYNQENIDKALSVTGLTTADLNGNLEVKPADRYEEFRVGDLFDAFLGIVTPNEMLLKKGKFPVITGVTENNGINGYFNEFIANHTYSNMITVSNRGVYSGTAYYHNYEFILGSNVIALKPLSFKMTENIALFIMTLINKLHYGGYDNYPTKSSILEDAILLPAIDENTPDFDYMEKAIYIYIKKVIKSWKMDNEKEIRALKSVINK